VRKSNSTPRLLGVAPRCQSLPLRALIDQQNDQFRTCGLFATEMLVSAIFLQKQRFYRSVAGRHQSAAGPSDRVRSVHDAHRYSSCFVSSTKRRFGKERPSDFERNLVSRTVAGSRAFDMIDLRRAKKRSLSFGSPDLHLLRDPPVAGRNRRIWRRDVNILWARQIVVVKVAGRRETPNSSGRIGRERRGQNIVPFRRALAFQGFENQLVFRVREVLEAVAVGHIDDFRDGRS